MPEHYAAILIISLNLLLIIWNSELAILIFIIPLILGVFDFLAFTPTIYFIKFSMPNISEVEITLQPFSLYVLISYFILGSAKHAISYLENKFIPRK